jgi:hypothetical protein
MKVKIWIVTLILLLIVAPLAVQAQDNRVNWTGSHTVQPGETLFRIALRYGVSVNTLASANGIFNPNVIYAGQVLVVPGSSNTPVEPGPVPGQPFDARVIAATNVYEGQSESSPVRHVLEPGVIAVMGRSADSAWVFVRGGWGLNGWVRSSALQMDSRLLAGLPVQSPHAYEPSAPHTVPVLGSALVFETPSLSAPSFAVISPGMTVETIGRTGDGNFVYIQANGGVQGWVLAVGIGLDSGVLNSLPIMTGAPNSGNPVPTTLQAQITQNGIPLRSLPGGQSPILSALSAHTVTVLARSWDNTWLRVLTRDRAEGWVWIGDTNLNADQILNLPMING